MEKLHIFTDGSVHVQSKIGYGACLIVSDVAIFQESLKNNIKIKRFEQTSSTKLELQTFLWALNEIYHMYNSINANIAITAYTDSQNIISLLQRQKRLEQNDYFSKNNKRLNNYELYKEFYYLMSKINCQIIKVKGHQNTKQKTMIDNLFELVDQASRRSLRDEITENIA